ncbi:hypothetical protein CEXT_336681 [Caerostris extrusa]|uniref:Uncharacterized protein n=1 Tax=Caerostris extrusa TaxID=172846 RepID=A0AAV4SBI9_CAEEX|nr:hypothetical protein CEXT_336681 [Caerostris extrusa]
MHKICPFCGNPMHIYGSQIWPRGPSRRGFDTINITKCIRMCRILATSFRQSRVFSDRRQLSLQPQGKWNNISCSVLSGVSVHEIGFERSSNLFGAKLLTLKEEGTRKAVRSLSGYLSQMSSISWHPSRVWRRFSSLLEEVLLANKRVDFYRRILLPNVVIWHCLGNDLGDGCNDNRLLYQVIR